MTPIYVVYYKSTAYIESNPENYYRQGWHEHHEDAEKEMQQMRQTHPWVTDAFVGKLLELRPKGNTPSYGANGVAYLEKSNPYNPDSEIVLRIDGSDGEYEEAEIKLDTVMRGGVFAQGFWKLS